MHVIEQMLVLICRKYLLTVTGRGWVVGFKVGLMNLGVVADVFK
jgi:hypothetical protein